MCSNSSFAISLKRSIAKNTVHLQSQPFDDGVFYTFSIKAAVILSSGLSVSYLKVVTRILFSMDLQKHLPQSFSPE